MPRQKFGQHFLTDPHAVAKIVQLVAAANGDHILEIGPGRGALTRPLLAAVGDGTFEAVEIDDKLARCLRDALGAHANCRVHHADALTFDLAQLAASNRPLRVVGNLPYNIAAPLLMRLLTRQYEAGAQRIADLHVMLQLEVANRLTAPAGDSEYSGLSVLAGCHARCVKLFELDAAAFDPPPLVRSAFVRLTPRPPLVAKEQWPRFKRLVNTAFARRRKKLRHAFGKDMDAAQLTVLGIDPDLRPQTLDAAAFARLAAHARPGD